MQVTVTMHAKLFARCLSGLLDSAVLLDEHDGKNEYDRILFLVSVAIQCRTLMAKSPHATELSQAFDEMLPDDVRPLAQAQYERVCDKYLAKYRAECN